MITIQINQADLDRVKTMLRGIDNVAPKVLSRAINDTLAGVKTDASTEIRNIITAKKSAVDGTFRTVKATVTQFSGLFESKGKPLPLIDFSARQTKAGVSVQVKKKNPRTVLTGAFIAAVRTKEQAAAGSTGHQGVFWRVYRGGVKGPVKKIAYGRLPRKYRLPIKQLFGPRIPDILGDEPVMAVVLKKADDRLHKNMDKELNYELSKL
jgi:hypothetical protein